MNASLVILWCGGQAALCGPDGILVRTGIPLGEDPPAELLRLWREEFPQATAARLVTTPDDPLAGAAVARFAAAARTEKRRLDGAWPLPELLAIASARPSLEIAAIGSVAAVRFAPALGEATARSFSGSKLAEAVAAEIHEALARVEDGSPLPALLVAEGCPAAEAIREVLSQARSLEGGPGGGAECSEIALASFLDRARSLAPGGAGDLFRERGGIRSPGRGRLIAAGLALLAGAGAAYLHRRYRLQAAEAARTAESLWRESAAARERRLDRDRIDAQRDAAQPPRPSLSQFLGALAVATPPAAVLESLRIGGSGFQLRGRVLSSAPPGAGVSEAMRRALFAPGSPWTEQTAPAPAPGEFALDGTFARGAAADAWPEAAGTPPLLPSVTDFPAQLAAWAPAWRIESGTGDNAGGLPAPKGSVPSDLGDARAAGGFESCRFVLTPTDLGSSAWAGLLGLARRLSSVPGLSIDRAEIEGAPQNDGSFTRMELVLTARLRPIGEPAAASFRHHPRPRPLRAH
ncbi:MAG: hypothetical protein ACREFX_06635 [Opitutaceae bacterium]